MNVHAPLLRVHVCNFITNYNTALHTRHYKKIGCVVSSHNNNIILVLNMRDTASSTGSMERKLTHGGITGSGSNTSRNTSNNRFIKPNTNNPLLHNDSRNTI